MMNENEKLSSVKAESESALTKNEIQAQNDLQADSYDGKTASSEAPSSAKKTSGQKSERKKRVKAESSADGKGAIDRPILENKADDTLTSSDEKEICSAEAEPDIAQVPIQDEVLENQLTLSLFSISSETFDNYTRSASSDEVEDIEIKTDKSDEEEILPPDELFAYRLYKPVPDAEPEAYNESEECTTEDLPSEEASEEDEENIGDDGQYTMSDFELQSDAYDKSYADEEISKYDPKKPRRIDGRFDLVELFVFTLLAVMIVTTFFFRHSIVEGSSMENTLHSGEHLIISDLFYTPSRGDIIVCEDYTTKIPKPIVKRVIGIEGDSVTVTEKGDVFVNGVLLEEDYVFTDGPYRQDRIDIVVPDGEIFVMGDHRNVSADSRDIGTISVDSVLGKVLLRFYPFDKFGTVN